MKKIYVDTSVVGGCFDAEFHIASNALIEEFKTGKLQLIRSDVVFLELAPARKEIRRHLKIVPDTNVIEVLVTPQAVSLALRYIRYGTLLGNSYHDALHIALATLNNADVIASWNFKHMVNIDKIKMYNIINEYYGHPHIEIMSPTNILNTLYEKEKTL